MVWCGVVWRGVVWRGVALCGVVWRCVALCGVAWCGVFHLEYINIYQKDFIFRKSKFIYDINSNKQSFISVMTATLLAARQNQSSCTVTVGERMDREWMEDGWRMDGGWMEDGWRMDGGWMEDGWRMDGGWMEDGWRMDGRWMRKL